MKKVEYYNAEGEKLKEPVDWDKVHFAKSTERLTVNEVMKKYNLTPEEWQAEWKWGTIIEETSTKTYYLDRESYSVHTSYPTRLENIVDEPLFCYFLSRLKRHYENIEIEAKLVGKIINHHKVNDEKIV